jgi:thiamine-phosphate pyrophosphorylase
VLDPLYGIVDRNLRALRIVLEEMHLLCDANELASNLREPLRDLVQRYTMEEHMLRARFSLDPASMRRGTPTVVPGQASLGAAELATELQTRMRSSAELTRALEEYFQFFRQPRVAQFFRRLRFEIYEYQRQQNDLLPYLPPASSSGGSETAGSARIAQALAACPLYFILDETICSIRDPLRTAFEAVAGGVKLMQLRFKHLPTRELLTLAKRVHQICAERECLLIVNDRLDIALLAQADGIHVGAEDIDPTDIRRAAPRLLIGVTARTVAAAKTAVENGADYIGAGSVFPSGTKPGLPVIRLAGLARIVGAAGIPVAAIGGITAENCTRVMAHRAAGFCAVSPFLVRRSVKALVQELRQACIASSVAGK